jgi:hypothetical protein
MYLRTTQRKNRDGSVIRYVQLAHNQQVEGVTQARVLLNLGREDQLDREDVTAFGPSLRSCPERPSARPARSLSPGLRGTSGSDAESSPSAEILRPVTPMGDPSSTTVASPFASLGA